jgi:hypothetical protein
VRGIEGRDALWDHPDLLPTADDLADPDAFVRGQDELSDLSDISDLSDFGDAGEPGEPEDPEQE